MDKILYLISFYFCSTSDISCVSNTSMLEDQKIGYWLKGIPYMFISGRHLYRYYILPTEVLLRGITSGLFSERSNFSMKNNVHQEVYTYTSLTNKQVCSTVINLFMFVHSSFFLNKKSFSKKGTYYISLEGNDLIYNISFNNYKYGIISKSDIYSFLDIKPPTKPPGILDIVDLYDTTDEINIFKSEKLSKNISSHLDNVSCDIKNMISSGVNIGSGSFGSVYKHCNKCGIVIKLSIDTYQSESDIRKIVSIMNMLNYLGIGPEIYKVIQCMDRKVTVTAMEYISGMTLYDHILNKGLTDAVLNELKKSIQLMHSYDIFHNDLSMENIMITNDEKVIFIDPYFPSYSGSSRKDITNLMKNVKYNEKYLEDKKTVKLFRELYTFLESKRK